MNSSNATCGKCPGGHYTPMQRRGFMQVGSLGALGLTLGDYFRMQARADDREPMLRRLVALLRAQHSLGEDVGEGYYGRYYQLVMAKRSNTKRLYLIPVKTDAFGDVHTQFEGRKEGLLSLVTDVRHVR